MLRGSAWTIALRWSLRLTGLVSTLILARLLTPGDYGVVAIATLVVGTIEVFAQTGQYNALMRHPDPTREHYDSVWTVTALLGFALGCVIWALAPLGASYFHEPRATLVVKVLTVRTVMQGVQSVGVVNFSRELNFRRQYQLRMIPQALAFFITVGLGVALRNYWALVIGVISQSAIALVLSYLMAPHRPRFCFSKVREIWSFSIWSFFRNLGQYVNGQIDKLAVGGFGGAAAMGRYVVASDVAASPTQELVMPAVTALLPVMAKANGDRDAQRDLYLMTLSWSALVCASTSIGIALVAEDMVDLVLGPKWHDVWPLIPWFALSWGIVGLTSGVSSVLLAMGHAYASARLQWSRNACYALAIFPVAYLFRDIETVAVTRFVVTVLVSPTIFMVLSRVLDVPLRQFASALWRPLSAGAIMAAIVLALNSQLASTGYARLALDLSTGSFTYVTALLALWWVTGRPPGVERAAWEYGRLRFAR